MTIRRFHLFLSALLVPLLGNLSAAETKPAPLAAKKPVVNEYQGTKVEDAYQWLENDNDPAVQAWSKAENARSRAYLDHLPVRAELEKQLTEWYAKTSPNYFELIARP